MHFEPPSIISGLGKLFYTASSSLAPHTPRGQRQLESVTEEAHTYDLLYPEAETLRQGQQYAYPFRHGDPTSVAAAAKSSDDKGGLDIQHPRDVRMIIAQNVGGDSRVLYDSQPPIPVSSSRTAVSFETTKDGKIDEEQESMHDKSVQRSHTAPHTRHPSLSHAEFPTFPLPASPLSPVNEFGSIFGGFRSRNNNGRPPTIDGETPQVKLNREEQEETEALLLCMFGSPGLPQVSCTKLHIKPFAPSGNSPTTPKSPGSNRPDSPRAFPKRRTPLTRSTTLDDVHGFTSSETQEEQQASRRKSSSILITKVFSVDRSDPDHNSATDGEDAKSTRDRAPRPRSLQDSRPSSSGGRTNKLRTPAFAVAIVLYMPSHQEPLWTPSSAKASSAFDIRTFQHLHDPGLATDHDVEYVMAHWSMLARALSSLEIVARCKISDTLAQLDVPFPAPPIKKPPVSQQQWTLKAGRLKDPPRPLLQLTTGALQQLKAIQRAVDLVSKRVASGLQVRLAIPGQGRWGIWREEARGISKWAGGREQNFFLFNLLTSFLGSHTEWLGILGRNWNKRRHSNKRNVSRADSGIVRHRTVIVSQDKMASRRLIFLLSAFLPSNVTNSDFDCLSPSTPTMTDAAYSSSPSYARPTSRRQSLRRTVNKSVRGRQDGNSETPQQTMSGASASSVDAENVEHITFENPPGYQHSRRTSDARSMLGIALPLSSNGSSTRKSSTTTTASVIQDSTVPVPHFISAATESLYGTAAEPRPGSSGSLASLSLQRTLSRSGSNDYSSASIGSQATGPWPSYWSSRRGSSTERSEALASSNEGLGISYAPKDTRKPHYTKKLAQMVEDVVATPNTKGILRSNPDGVEAPRGSDGQSNTSAPQNIAHNSNPEPFSLNLSVNEKDGVIDVELPPLDHHMSSFGSTMSSPRTYRTPSSSFNDQSQSHSLTSRPASPPTSILDPTVGVAGWLRTYHQDFTLQAVRPYDALKADIKQSMRTEPAPSIISNEVDPSGENSWTDICTTLIADNTNFTIKLLTLRRRYPNSPHHQADALMCGNVDDNPDEEIVEESLTNIDPILTEAVERVLSHSGQSSRAASRPSSPPRSKPRATDDSSSMEIPRNECKKIILGALEQIAKSVNSEMRAQAGKGKDSQEERGGEEGMASHNTLRDGVQTWLREAKRGEA